MRHTTGIIPVAIVAAAVAVGAGCATKKYVQNTVNPIEQRVGELDKRTTEHGSTIEELERGVSRADERAMSADAKAVTAAAEAAKANEQAAQAGKSASDARSLAEQGIGRADMASRKVENYDNYKLVFAESVLFDFGKSELTDEAKAKLAEAAGKVSSAKHFVIEVQGFTDKTGPKNLNLELSRRRAAAVVRYLTLEHKIPLYRVHTLGFGSEAPVADNSTRDGRKQNRRVEVKLYAADLSENAQLAAK